MKVYEGVRDPEEPNAAGECVVFVNGQTLPPGPSLKVRNHSPTGFSWGYGGSGPAQLALAIMLDHFDGNASRAQSYYQDFKWKHVARWPQDAGWKITQAEIAAFVIQRDTEQPERRNDGRGDGSQEGESL